MASYTSLCTLVDRGGSPVSSTTCSPRTSDGSGTFFVNLSNPSPNAYLDDSQGLATIGNDD